jgi:hypothetical protein
MTNGLKFDVLSGLWLAEQLYKAFERHTPLIDPESEGKLIPWNELPSESKQKRLMIAAADEIMHVFLNSSRTEIFSHPIGANVFLEEARGTYTVNLSFQESIAYIAHPPQYSPGLVVLSQAQMESLIQDYQRSLAQAEEARRNGGAVEKGADYHGR